MTWNAALVFTYGPPVPGRETAALQNFANAQAYFGGLAADGKCEVDAYLWGYGGGMMTVKAESTTDLYEMMESEDGQKMLGTANYTSQDFHFQMAQTGDRLAESMANYASIGGQLGYL